MWLSSWPLKKATYFFDEKKLDLAIVTIKIDNIAQVT